MTAAFQNLQASSWGRMGVRRSWSVDRAGFVFGFIEDIGIPPGSVEIQQSSKKEGAGKGRLFERSMGDPRRKGIAVTKQGKDGASRLFCLLMLIPTPIHPESPTDPSKTLTCPILPGDCNPLPRWADVSETL